MHKRILIPVLCCVAAGIVVQTAGAQVLTGRLVTSFYGWERQMVGDSSTSHMRAYENVTLHFGNNNISFHTHLQGSTDFGEELNSDPRLRMFNGYLDFKNLGDLADLRIGRQSVYAGVNYGSIDGVHVRVRPTDGVQIKGYGGGLTPADQRTDFFHNLDNNWQVGSQVLLHLIKNTTISLSYMNRHRETTPYMAYREDPTLGTNVLTPIDYGSRANQYGSLNLSYKKDEFFCFGRYDYDFNFERTSRIELASTYQVMPKLGLSFSLAHREPQIAYNSYFNIFEMSATQEAVLGVDYYVHPRLAILGRFSGVKYDLEDEGGEDTFSDMAYRASIGAANKYASIMYTKDISYDGDLDGFNFDLRYPLFNAMFIPHIGAVYSNYALADDLEKSSTYAAVLGAVYRPVRYVSVDVQGQYMTNKIYDRDMRIFARINYWFTDPFSFNRSEDEE